MTAQSPEAIDSLVVFRVYAVLAAMGAVSAVVFALLLASRDAGLPAGPAATMALTGLASLAFAGYAQAFTRVDDPAGRMRGLRWFAGLHVAAAAFLALVHQLAAGTGRFAAPSEAASVSMYAVFAANLLVGGLVLLYLGLTAQPRFRFEATLETPRADDGSGQQAFALREKAGPASVRHLRSQYEEQIRRAARQEERARLARDLHDAVRQQLFVVQTAAATAQARFGTDPAGAQQAVEQIRTAARDALGEMDAMLDQLQAAPIANAGLVDGLRTQAEALGSRTGATVTVDVRPLPPPQALPPGAQEALYRVAQEAFANIGRHARATHVTVTLSPRGRFVALEIADDGRGFDVRDPRGGMGLSNMQARAAEVGGRFGVTARPGAGTTISFAVPVLARPARSYLMRAGVFTAVLVALAAAGGWVGADLRPWWLGALGIAAIGAARHAVAFARVRRHARP